MSSNSILNDEVILKRLKEVSFFQMYADNDDVISKIAQICTKKIFKKGNYLIKEGDYGDTLYIILSGEIEILKKTLQNEKYTVTSLYAEMGGLSVGELALIDNDQRSATVYATTDCECLVITRNDFIKFGDENPKIGLNITRVIASQLSSKLRKSTSDVITLFSALVEEISEYD
jgi:CRP-like cAMP-binding protein